MNRDNKTEEQRHHQRFMERLRSMSREERGRTLEIAGIVNERGELTREYGGTAEPSRLKRKLPIEG